MRRSPNDIQLWLADPRLPSAADDRLAEVLAPGERERAARFVNADDRASYIAAHALARIMLGEMTESDPRQVRFETTESGKPRVAYPEAARALSFSISHTRGLVACAACHGDGTEVGVDVEIEREPPLDIVRHYFAAPERDLIDQAPPDARADLFFTLWTLKESVLKATGTGLATELSTFACSVSPPSVLPFGELETVASEWHLWHERVGTAHHVAVATRVGDAQRPHLRVRHVTMTELLESFKTLKTLKTLRDPTR